MAGEEGEVFICGGSEIYREAIALADRIYLTVVRGRYEGDAFFPAIPDVFVEAGREEVEGPAPCSFIIYERLPEQI
jgi:dihydrofolate reductase